MAALLLWCLSAVLLATATAAVHQEKNEFEKMNPLKRPVTPMTTLMTTPMSYRMIEESVLECSGNVTEEGNITTPNYPGNYPSGLRCVTWIQAPECHTITITFNAFDLHESNLLSNCDEDFLEIIYGGPLDSGDVLCGTDITPGKVIISSSNQITLDLKTGTSKHSGVSADIAFVPIPECTLSPSGDPIDTRQSNEDCTEVIVDSTTSLWMSPLFGQSDYENNEFCHISRSSSCPSWAIVRFNTFVLESCCDEVSFTQPFTSTDLGFNGDHTGEEIRLPSYNFDATFDTDGSIVRAGFNITITQETSNCHQLIITGDRRRRGIIKTPRLNNNVWTSKGCEWWIRAPEGKQIKLKFLKMRLSDDCDTSSVIVNGDGDKSYPTLSSNQYCGTSLPPKIISSGNEMNVLFSSTIESNRFKARWIVV